MEDIILKQIQPYSAEYGAHPKGDLLWRLITTDNIDKHRLITPTVGHVRIEEGELENGCKIENIGLVGDVFPGIKFKGTPFLSLDILFSNKTRLFGNPVTIALIEGCDFVEEIVEIFEDNFKPKIYKKSNIKVNSANTKR